MVPSQTCEVINVTSRNWRGASHALFEAINEADFVSIDTEMSGIGSSKDRNAKSIDKRYQQVSELAASRAIIALGVACFKKSAAVKKDTVNTDGSTSAFSTTYTAAVFNISTMPKSKYWIEPSAATFLADHGFDFNSQIQYGVRFTPGFTYPEHEPISENDAEKAAVETTPSTTGNKRRKKMIANGRGDPPNSGGSLYFQDDAIDSKHSLRELFRLLMTKKVVVHNGFLDVIYLYHALYAPLPPTLSTFIADLCEIFAHGIIDTKYIAEYEHRDKATFLEYLFRKYQRSLRSKGLFLEMVPWNVLQSISSRNISAPDSPSQHRHQATGSISKSDINYVVFGKSSRADSKPPGLSALDPTTASVPAATKESVEVCKNYAVHGVCFKNRSGLCAASHDLDDILDAEDRRLKPGAKRGVILTPSPAELGSEQGLGSSAHQDTHCDVTIAASADASTSGVPLSVPAASATIRATNPGENSLREATDVGDSRAKRRRKRKRKNNLAAITADGNGTAIVPTKASVMPPSCPDAFSGNANVTVAPVTSSAATIATTMTAPETPIESGGRKNSGDSRCQGHRAGFDAFMTGYCYAAYDAEYDAAELASFTNKIYLVGCQRPLLLRKSAFSAASDTCLAAQLRNRTRMDTLPLTVVHKPTP